MNETEIVIQMQQGKEEAFDLLFDMYKNKAFRLAYLISGSYTDSEDIVQEAFVTCYVNRKQLKEPACFSKWLYQIITRSAWRSCRKRKKEQPVEEVFDEFKEDPSEAPCELVIRQEEKDRVYEAVCALDRKQKTVVIFYYYQQLTTREIADILGCMEGTVKSRLHTARKKLSKALEDMGWQEEEKIWTKKNWIL